MAVPTSTAPPPELGRPGEHCAHCGAALAPDQRYCLNCGLRRAGPRVDYRELLLGEPGGSDGAAPPPPPAAPAAAPASKDEAGETRAVSPLGAAVAIGLLLLATLLGAVIGRGSGSDSGQPVVVGGAPAGAAAAGAVASEWKAGDAWTVQLQAFPKDSTTPEQVQEARSAAQAKGAQDVGVLVSDDFPSLTAGRYIVYSGSHATRAEADRARASLAGTFPDAVVIRVSKTAGAAGAAAGEAKAKGSGGASPGGSSSPPAAVQDLQRSTSTKDYVNKSKKLPDKVGTGGAAPPKDDKAPGGDSGGGTTIG